MADPIATEGQAETVLNMCAVKPCTALGCCCWSTFAAEAHVAYPNPEVAERKRKCGANPPGLLLVKEPGYVGGNGQAAAILASEGPKFESRSLCCTIDENDVVNAASAASIVDEVKEEATPTPPTASPVLGPPPPPPPVPTTTTTTTPAPAMAAPSGTAANGTGFNYSDPLGGLDAAINNTGVFDTNGTGPAGPPAANGTGRSLVNSTLPLAQPFRQPDMMDASEHRSPLVLPPCPEVLADPAADITAHPSPGSPGFTHDPAPAAPVAAANSTAPAANATAPATAAPSVHGPIVSAGNSTNASLWATSFVQRRHALRRLRRH